MSTLDDVFDRVDGLQTWWANVASGLQWSVNGSGGGGCSSIYHALVYNNYPFHYQAWYLTSLLVEADVAVQLMDTAVWAKNYVEETQSSLAHIFIV